MPSIPDDIRTKATAIVNRFTVAANTTQNLEAIAEAIAAEREQCARHCEAAGFPDLAYDLRNP